MKQRLAIGTRVVLKASPKRYHGGGGVIIAHEQKPFGYVVRREGPVGQGKRVVWVAPGEITVEAPPEESVEAEEQADDEPSEYEPEDDAR